jgi:hypothetical protein
MPSRVASWETRVGRQDELEKTGTGEAVIRVHDTEGLYDPSNTSSPYFGQLDGAPVSLNLWNPVTETWHTRFTGNVEEYTYDLSKLQNHVTVEIRCVDAFDYLSTAEMAPGIHGFAIPAGAEVSEGTVFYEDAEVDERIHGLLTDAQWPLDRRRIFSGNVVCQECIYDGGYSFLAAMQDAADAEFPGVANVYVDVEGNVVFHGRHARFDPDTVAAGAGSAWNFTRWKVGDGTAIAGDADYAQLRPPLNADRSTKLIYNSALIYPAQTTETAEEFEALISANIVQDLVSIAQYGLRSYTATDLRVLEHKTNGNDGWEETLAQADYYVQNYSQPQTRPRQITVKAVHPSDARAPATWAFLCGVQISDVIHLKVNFPGGGGFDAAFFVEGVRTICRPLGPFTPVDQEYAYVEVTCDVSPAAYWTEDTFPGDA